MSTDLPAHLIGDSLVWRLVRKGMPVDQAEAIAERAAIMEYDGKMLRREAEELAVKGNADGTA